MSLWSPQFPSFDSPCVVRFPKPPAIGSNIHGSCGTWLPLVYLLSSFLLQGELSGVPTPHASTPWSGPNPPTSEVSCFLLTLFIIWIVWVNYFNLQQPVGNRSPQCSMQLSTQLETSKVFKSNSLLFAQFGSKFENFSSECWGTSMSLQCPLFASSSVSAKSVFSNEICYECVMIKISGIPRLPLFVARDPMAIRQKMAISSGNGAINWW